MRTHLRFDVTIDQAIQKLDLIADNAFGAAMPVGDPAPGSIRERYVRWALHTEQELIGVLDRRDAMAIFENPRHRDICSMIPGEQLTNLISAEVAAKSNELREIAIALRAAQSRATCGPGCPTIVDTNLLLQCQRPDQIPWRKLVCEQVRLVVPLRVIEELDAKKYSSSERLRRLSKELLPWLESLFGESECGPVSVNGCDDTTVEVYFADRPRYRPIDADEEVLDTYHEVALLAGKARLVTRDTGMRLRARAQGVEVIELPPNYDRLAD